MSLCNSCSAFKGNWQTSDNRASCVFPFFVNIVIVTSKNYLQSKALSNLGISLHPLGPVSPQEEAALFAKLSWCQHGGRSPQSASPRAAKQQLFHREAFTTASQKPLDSQCQNDLRWADSGQYTGWYKLCFGMTPLQHVLNLVSSSSSSLGLARSSIFQLCSYSLALLPSGYY